MAKPKLHKIYLLRSKQHRQQLMPR